MKSASFVHLHTHSQYSLLDGACRIDDVIALAKEYKMPALAITDHGAMFGAVEFYSKALKAGIKPLLGMEAYVSAGPMTDRKQVGQFPAGGFHLLLLARNNTGYHNLIKIASAGYLEGFYHRPRVDHDYLRAHSSGITATSACPQGEVNWHLSRGHYDQAKSAALAYESIFGRGNFYLEIQNHGLDVEQKLLPLIVQLSEDTKIPLVCSNDCHYLKRDDASAHDVLLCIQTGKVVEDRDRLRYDTDQIYFKTPEEMRTTFGDFPEAYENTIRIAEECSVELELGKLHLPQFVIPRPYSTADEYLRTLTQEGLRERYGEITDTLTNRLDFELSVIKRMGYAGYFLIVKDFCDYARKIGVRVGPGRGSAAGSIVSYTLRITSLDPIKYSLLFERFLNPDRISMPDIDIDFADRGRDKIIEYVIQKYGKENVCQIITFGTMAARASVRDVGRALSMPYGEVDKIAKMIPFAVDMTLTLALEKNPELAKLVQSDARVERLLDVAKRLEGLTRHASTHAAGVVIAPSALTDFVPLFKGSNDEITTQFDMKRVEEIGLLKMDFLGLRTLTVIDDAVAMIERSRGEKFDIDLIPLDDPAVFSLFAKGQTIGIFQFESSGMRDYLRKLQPEGLNDLIAMNALYRPGPLDGGMVDVYIQRKKEAKSITFLHPALETILKDTYGVIVYQEQVLQIANSLAGYSMGKADLLRKAMGKKDSHLMAEQKKEFLAGCDTNKIDKKISGLVFDQIETFARYGFNKAHSACYAFLAYQTAYLKVHYPLEFFAASMTSEIDNSDRIFTFMEECRTVGITVLPPDLNESHLEFTPTDKTIRFGLLGVKNVGEGAVRAIIAARENEGKFRDLADFVTRTPVKALNRRTLESLIQSGASDSLSGTRSQKLEAVEKILDYGVQAQKITTAHDLFAEGAGVIDRQPPKYKDLPEFPVAKLLSMEKEVLGFYVSGHPLDEYRVTLANMMSGSIAKLSELRDNSEVKVAGIVTTVKMMNDKRGKQMAFVTLEDHSGSTEVICFSDCFEKSRGVISEGSLVMVLGRISTREGEASKILANELAPLASVAERFDCQLVMKISVDVSDTIIETAVEAISKAPGEASAFLVVRYNGSEAWIRCEKYKVRPSGELLSRLRGILGDDAVILSPR